MKTMVYALYAFAVAFVIVGFFRIVEFKAAGVSVRKRWVLIPLHILGTLLFAAAIALLGYDEHMHEKLYMGIAFGGGVLILFPLHIYLGIKRRILLRDRAS